MPSWNEIMNELNGRRRVLPNGQLGFDYDGLLDKYVRAFSDIRNRNVIVYYSDWLNQIKGPNIDLNDSDMIGFMNCVHKLDKTKGLDLVLHTPGGSPLATEGIVKYLHKIFGNNIEVFVPHMAMSAGTMLACSGKKIWMGKESFLGPIDPQFGGIPAYNIKKEFEDAKKELINKPESFRSWQILLSKYSPAFYYSVLDSIELSSKLVAEWLESFMFSTSRNAKDKAAQIVNSLNINTGSHSKHFGADECKKIGLKIKELESDDKIQDAVLSIYHCCSICGNGTPMCKIIMNQNGNRYFVNGVLNQGAK